MSIAVLHSSVKQDWQTPDEVLAIVRKVGAIALDPCTVDDNPTGAVVVYTPADDGLRQSWATDFGIVFVNPPYGRELPEWVVKAIAESRRCCIVMLTPARPDTRWGQALMKHSVAQCWWRGRIKFRGAQHAAPFPNVFTLLGGDAKDRAAFIAAFSQHGRITGKPARRAKRPTQTQLDLLDLIGGTP